MRIIANVHQIPNYLTDTRTLCKTFNILPLPSLLVYFNSIYGYQIFNNSDTEFVSNLFVSVNSRAPRSFLNFIHIMRSRLIRPSRSRTMIYQFLFAHLQFCPVLNTVHLNNLSHLYSFLLFFPFLVFALNVKDFAKNDLDCQIKY